jgi:cytochrome P450
MTNPGEVYSNVSMSLFPRFDENFLSVTNVLLTAAFMVALVITMSSFWKGHKQFPSQYRLPPVAPFSFWESLEASRTGTIAWFFRSVTRRMGHLCRLTFVLPFQMVFVSANIELNRQILTDPDTKKSPQLKNFNKITAGTTQFFTSNGYRFYHARKAMAPAFANNHIKRMEKVTIAKTEAWIQGRLDDLVNHNQDIDVNKEMVGLTLSVILEAAFEYEMSIQEQEAMMECVRVTLKTFVFPNPFKMSVWFLFPSIWRAHQKAREFMQIARNIMSAYRSNQSPTKGTVIDLIMNNPNYDNDDERAADVIDIIVAGHETSANSMTFLLLELAKHKQEQQRLYQELLDLSPEDRNGCDHLKNCVREAMRLWPVTAVGPVRVAGRDFVVPANNEDDTNDKFSSLMTREKDYFIPKGSLVFMPSIGTYHNELYFDEPESFIPSRWEDPSEDMKKAFLPFSVGKRSCLGQSLALSEMHSILSRLLVQYEFSVVQEGTTGYFITLKPEGVLLKATRR